MRPPLARLRALPLALACALAAPAAVARTEEPAKTAAPTIYKWVDANGVAHYTTELSRVPRSVRGSVRALGPASPPASEGFATRDAAAAAPAPAVAPLPEWDVGDAPPPAPAPVPQKSPAGSGDRWAESDRPFDLPDEEPGAASAAPTQTAAAQPSEAAAPPSAADLATQREGLDARIAALEAEIASDEGALKGFLAVPAPENPAEVAYDQSFREVAERLPRRLAELRSLKGERAQLETP